MQAGAWVLDCWKRLIHDGQCLMVGKWQAIGQEFPPIAMMTVIMMIMIEILYV